MQFVDHYSPIAWSHFCSPGAHTWASSSSGSGRAATSTGNCWSRELQALLEDHTTPGALLKQHQLIAYRPLVWGRVLSWKYKTMPPILLLNKLFHGVPSALLKISVEMPKSHHPALTGVHDEPSCTSPSGATDWAPTQLQWCSADNLIPSQMTKLFPAVLHHSQSRLNTALIHKQFFLSIVQDEEKYIHTFNFYVLSKHLYTESYTWKASIFGFFTSACSSALTYEVFCRSCSISCM